MLAASEQAPGDLAVVRVAVHGLLEASKPSVARRVLGAARFLRPGNTELAGLWEEVKFEAARQAQKAERTTRTHETTRYAQDAQFAKDGDRVTLPFVRIADDTDAPKVGTVRRDAPSFPRPHLARLWARKADR